MRERDAQVEIHPTFSVTCVEAVKSAVRRKAVIVTVEGSCACLKSVLK